MRCQQRVSNQTHQQRDNKVVSSVEPDVAKGKEQTRSEEPKGPDDRSFDDTLNPDGTNASILFFEETFMSNKFSHLSTSSPRTLPNASRVMSKQSAAFVPNRAQTSPAKRSRGDTRVNGSRRHEDSVTMATYSHRNRGQRNTIPSWVRQRRCLPTIDDVDFDHIDDISLHSLSANEGRLKTSPAKHSSRVGDNIVKATNHQPLGSRMEETSKGRPVNNNRFANTGGSNVSQRRGTGYEPMEKISEHCRSVLGDLTNKNDSPVKTTGRAQSKVLSYKMPRRNSAAERRARRNRKTGSRRSKSASRESLINGMDRLNEHTYVNLEYIAGIMTDSPPRENGQKDQGRILDKAGNRPLSPAEEARSTTDSTRKELYNVAAARNDDEKHNTKYAQERKRGSDQTKDKSLIVSPCTDDSEFSLKQERCMPASSVKRPIQNKLSGFVNGVREEPTICREARKEKLSSTSSWESATNSHSTEGDECAAILSADVKNQNGGEEIVISKLSGSL